MKSSSLKNEDIAHPLMFDNVTKEDIDQLILFLQQDNQRLTQGKNVLDFESEWSDWLGVRYSVFVNSGSSANLITLAVLKELYGSGEILVPPLTWVSDIVAVLRNGLTPVFVDIDPRTLAMDTEKTLAKISKNTRGVFLTHVQGFNGLNLRMLEELRRQDIPLIEDVCESHGAVFNGEKLGSFGLMSNFSFYYAHHLSTIEGGMVCTNNEEIYQMLRMYRSHGMVREASNEALQKAYSKEYPSLNPDFIFAYPAYNVRNTEIGAVIGRRQLKRLDENNERRIHNHKLFLTNLDSNRFRTDFEVTGSCNYAFNIILKDPDFALRDKLEVVMKNSDVEFRRGSSGGGNQMRQPYLKDVLEDQSWKNYPEVEHIHHFGWYVGNYPELEESKIMQLCDLVNDA